MTDPLAAALDSRLPKLKLPLAEWDFCSLIHKHPANAQRYELRAAVYYEYARESPSIHKLAKQFSELPRALRSQRWSNYRSITDELFFFMGLPFSHCVFWPKFFPGSPWLEIPISQRQAAVRRYIKRTTATLFELKGYDEVRRWEVSDKETRRFTSGIEHLIIAINWTIGSNDDIIAAVAKWIRHRRPAQFSPPRGDASRENVAEAFLTRLAVVRLLHNYSHVEALRLAETYGVRMPKQQSNALRMRQRVRRDIPLIFQSAGLKAVTGRALISPGERPLSWQTVSEKRRFRSTR